MSNITTLSSLLSRERSRGVREISNVTGVDRSSIENAVDNSLMVLVRQPPLRQFGMGLGAGWLSGYVFIKVSQLAAILGGCSALIIWGAHSAGIIEFNWERVRGITDSNTALTVRQFTEHTLQERNHIIDRVLQFCRAHVFISSGFATGVIISLMW